MPQIVIRTSGVESERGAEVMRERVVASDLESEQFASQLVQRIGWALADADGVERRHTREPKRRRARAA
jgi:hypothetical protein